MGVFKWLRRERVTVTTHTVNPEPTTPQDVASQDAVQVGTIRTEEYKRDLAEFQARRSIGNKESPETPVRKKCGRHSLSISCTDCAADRDNTFSYEKKSALKYKKKCHKRVRNSSSDEKLCKVPNIQFLFQNQVFMPGNIYTSASYTEPQMKATRHRHYSKSPEKDNFVQKQLSFEDDEGQQSSPPLFFKNNSLPFDVKNFLDCARSDEEVVDGLNAAGDVKVSSHSSESAEGQNKDGSCEHKLWEVMSELNQWADEQLQNQLPSTKSEDNRSNASICGFPMTSVSDVDITSPATKDSVWSKGKWGVIPVQIKKLPGVTLEHVKKKLNTEINILGKYRHPNIILLMSLFTGAQDTSVHIVCEMCVDSLYGILHEQGQILSAQSSVHYALDIANALVFLRMQGYLHTELSSSAIMITNHDAAKLADLSPCARLRRFISRRIDYETYSPEPQYVNIEDTRRLNTNDCEPLISQHPSETYINDNSVPKPYTAYRDSNKYNYHAPELFEGDTEGLVYPCSKSDVYSLCLILWESCNAAVPWKSLNYDKLKGLYFQWKTGIKLPQDGTYPGGLLSLLQDGLLLDRSDRLDLLTCQSTLQTVKHDMDQMEYIIIPARLSRKQSNFSSIAWDTSPTDSEAQSPKQDLHSAVVHISKDSSDSSEKDCNKSDSSPLYETIRKDLRTHVYPEAVESYVSDEEIQDKPVLKYQHLPEKEFSSACSTPISKIRAKHKYSGTPGALHRSDSTEYCSILSPRAVNFELNNDSTKDKSSIERPTAKLSRSFTPKSYKPLHIKVPELNVDCLKSLPKDKNVSDRSSYSFDVRNYSLPTTPIARSNKLRRNAWLSGDIDDTHDKKGSECAKIRVTPEIEVPPAKTTELSPETPVISINSSLENEQDLLKNDLLATKTDKEDYRSPESLESRKDSLRSEIQESSPDSIQEHTNIWSSYRQAQEQSSGKFYIDDDTLARLSVAPLVAIHERWIYEANRKTGRSMSLPEDNRSEIIAVKPASHCVDTLQQSLPPAPGPRRPPPAPASRPLRPPTPHTLTHGGNWEHFCQARDNIAKNINLNARENNRYRTWKKGDKGTVTDETTINEPKVDQATDTKSLEDFMKDLIRKEFQKLLSDMNETSPLAMKHELLNKGMSNIMESLKNGDTEPSKDITKSFSRIKINGNNKPLLQITFARSGESSLQVLDNCVNVTICDANVSDKDRMNISVDEPADDLHVNSLKRCQAFNALQEARSTEDLYIDDDLSAQMQENFGGKVKLLPLHGSLHEILCEKEDECCLIKLKQENGCDTIYFKCDNSDTESRDACDGQDTVVFKRSISLVEERIQRIMPKEKRSNKEEKTRPKSEIFPKKIDDSTRALSNSSPSLTSRNKEEVEVNIENVMCYQDSSSDECIKCHVDNDDFELLERKIEEDLINSNLSTLTCGCLEKISEENLSVINDDITEKDQS